MTIDQADVEFNRAVALIGELRYQKAISALAVQEGVAVSTHRIVRAAECAFWHGYCREKLGDRRQAAIIYRKLMDIYPRTPAAAQAARRLAAIEPRTPKSTGN
jgi:TolA-binding protein